MERMMSLGAPPMTPGRYQQIAVLWEMAEQSSNGSVEGLAWAVAVERSESGKIIQLVASGQGCRMLVNPGQWHHNVIGAVDAFFHSNGDILAARVVEVKE